MYKDKEKQKEAVKEAVQRHREGITRQGITQEGITKGMTPDVLPYPAIILALADPEKKDKLTRICNQLRVHRLLENVRYGIGGPTFTEVDKMLLCLKAT